MSNFSQLTKKCPVPYIHCGDLSCKECGKIGKFYYAAALKWALSCKSTYEDCHPWDYIDTEIIEQELEAAENEN